MATADTLTRRTADADILQEGVSCAIATLDAISAAGFFDALPPSPEDFANHEKGSWLLAMLRDQLGRIQSLVNEKED